MVGTSDTYASSEASSAVKSDKRNASYMNSSGHIPLKTSNHPPPSAVASVSPYGLTRPPAGPPNPGMMSPQLKRSEAPYFPAASAGGYASSTGSARSHEPFHHNMRWNPHYPPPQQMHPRHFHPQHHPRARPPFYPPQQQQEMPLLERKKIEEEILLRQRELDSCWQEDEFDCPRDFTAIDRKKEYYAESSDEPYAAREQTFENDDHIGKSVSNENLCFSPPWVEEKNKSHQFAPTYERKTQGSATSNQLTATSRGYHQAPLPPSSRTNTKVQAVVPPIPRKKVNINNIVRHISYTEEPEVPQNLASIWPQSEMGSRIPSSERIAYSPLCMSALPSGAQTPMEEEVEEKAASDVSSSASKSSSHASKPSSDTSQHKDQQIGHVNQQQQNQIQHQNLNQQIQQQQTPIKHQNQQQQNQNQQQNLSQQQNQIQQNQSQNSEPTEQQQQHEHDPLKMYKESSQFKQAYTMLPPQVDVVKMFRDGSELGSRIPSCEQINLSPLTMSGLTSGVQTPLEPNTGAIPLASLSNQNNATERPSTERLVSTTERPESPHSVYSEASIDSNESGAAEKLIARAQCSSTPPLRDNVEQHDYIQNFSTFEQSELSSRIPSCERIPLSPLCQSELPSGCQTPEEVEVTTTTEPPSDEPPSSAAAGVVMRPKKASKLEEIMAKMNLEGGPPRLDDYQNDSVKIFGQSEHSSRMQSRENLYFTPPWSASTSGLVTPCNGAVVKPTVQKIVEEDNENKPNDPVPVENYSAQKPAPPQQQRRDSSSSEESTFSNHTDISTVVNAPMSMHNTAPASPIPDGSEESYVSCKEPLNDLSECYSRTGSPTGGANQSSINQFNQQQLQWYKQHQQQQPPPHPAPLNQNNMVQRSLSDQRRTHEEHDQRHVDQSVKEKFCRINDHDSITDQFNQIKINNANPPPSHPIQHQPPHPIQHQPPHSHLSNIHHRPPHHPPFSQPHPPYFNQNTYPRFPHHHPAGNFAQPPHSTRPPHQMVSRPPFHAQRLMAPNMHPRHESMPPRPFFQHFSPQQHKPEYEQPSDFADYPNDFEDEAVFPNQRVPLKRMQTIPEANQQRHPRFPPKHQPFPPHNKPYNMPPDIRGERSYSVTSLEPNRDSPPRDSPPRDSDTLDNISLVSFASQAATNQNMDTKADMMTSLLSMLGTHEPDEMARTLLAISRSPDSCVAMRQSGYLPIIVDLLHHHDNGKINWGTRQRAARALHNIVHLNSNDRRGKREVRVLGWLESIRCYSETVLADGDKNYRPQLPDHLREHGPGPAVAAIMKLSFEEEHKNTICELGGLQTVGELLVVDYMTNSHCRDNYAIFLRKYAGMVLINLTYNDSSNKTILSMLPKTMNAIVAQLLTPGEEDLVQVFAGIIRNVSWRPDQNTQHSLQEANAVRALMTCIQKLHSEVCIRAVLSAVWNLSAHSSENKEEICRTPGSLTYLAYALSFQSESQNFSVQENAGGILRNISSHIAVSNEYRRLIRQGGCMQTLVAQLRSPSTRVVSNSTGILWNLSARCVDDQNLLWELGAVSVLKNLVNSKHKSISASSAAALRNLLAVKPGSGTDTETVTSFQHRTNSLPHRNKAGRLDPKNKSMRGKQKEKPKAYIDNSSESGFSHTPPPVMYPKVLERYEGASEQSSMLYFPRHHRNHLPNPVPEKVSSWIDKCSREKLIVDAYEDAPQSVCADTIRGYPPPTPKFTPKSKRRPLTPRLGLKSRKQKSSTDTVRSSKETLNTDEKGVWMKNFKQKILRKSYSSDIDEVVNAGAEKKSFFEIYNMSNFPDRVASDQCITVTDRTFLNQTLERPRPESWSSCDHVSSQSADDRGVDDHTLKSAADQKKAKKKNNLLKNPLKKSDSTKRKVERSKKKST